MRPVVYPAETHPLHAGRILPRQKSSKGPAIMSHGFPMRYKHLLQMNWMQPIINLPKTYFPYSGKILPRWNGSKQWRIQDFPQGGAPTPKIAIIFQNFAKNCMKMKEFGPPGGARVPGAPPWIRQCKGTCNVQCMGSL